MLLNKVINGDCLKESEQIESGSVDLILTDPPYGTVKDISAEGFGMSGKTKWDEALNPKDIFNIANRILRKNGKLVLFSQEPYTSKLITEALPNLPFSYRMIWEKDHYANALLSKKAPVSYFEDILVFSKCNPKHDFEGAHPLRDYFNTEKEKSGLSNNDIFNLLGNQMGSHYFTSGAQFTFPTFENYNKLQASGFFMRDWNELKKIDDNYRSELIKKMTDEAPAVFNLWEGKSYKSNVLKYKKDYNGHHPTQKPLLLMEDLIKTYSNEGDLVVDLTAGSGSTAVAAITTKRNFIAIEKEESYYKIIKQRINSPQTRLDLCC